MNYADLVGIKERQRTLKPEKNRPRTYVPTNGNILAMVTSSPYNFVSSFMSFFRVYSFSWQNVKAQNRNGIWNGSERNQTNRSKVKFEHNDSKPGDYALSYFRYIRSLVHHFSFSVAFSWQHRHLNNRQKKKESNSSLPCRFLSRSLRFFARFAASGLLEFTKPPIDPI